LSLGNALYGDNAHIYVADTTNNPLSWLRAHDTGLYIYRSDFVHDIRASLGVGPLGK
jgi:hypothetical protein